MKIVIAETLYPVGHKSLDEKFIETLSSLGELLVINSNGYFSNKICEEYRTKTIKQFIPKYFEFIYTIVYFINLCIVAFNLRKEAYDKIIFLSTRIDSLFFALPFFRKDSIIVVHHNDIDRMLSRPFESFIFKRYMNEIDHVVLAEFIKDGLIEKTSVDERRVHVVHQPSLEKRSVEDMNLDTRKPVVIGLGQSMSQDYIDTLIAEDKNGDLDIKYSFLLRSKTTDYQGKHVIVSTEYLDRRVYDERLLTSSVCIVFYPKSFNLRYSGVIDDALNHGLVVYCNDIAVGKYFANKYPNSCRLVKEDEGLVTPFKSSVSAADKEEINNFLLEHSGAFVTKQWKCCLDRDK